ncbi:hypothetical protein C2G38_2217899 [Gigaspora rosea]|uniref:Uncharacterized protein n=1 Tax=Gigaspora rosea TaxID=44941 RepID=A0A397U7C6_9GLOM|nr:hypothetical protein C2G38_2217899 [Gigaspora rosea]
MLHLLIENFKAINNEIVIVIIIKFHELDQLDQVDQWTNEENIQAIINILEENIDEIGYEHRCGIGAEKDEHKAFIYYQKSAEIGDAMGINNAGQCYLPGIGV